MSEQEKIITIYGASSAQIPAAVLHQASECGAVLAEKGLTLMCGGGRTGVMGAAIDGALRAGGRAIGVLPRFMIERGWAHPNLSERLITENMHERKETMLRCAQSVIAFPGGIGTFEEVFEAITWRQLGLWRGQIVLLNIDGYYDPLLKQLYKAVAEHYMNPDHLDLFTVAEDARQAVDMALRPDDHTPFTQKIEDTPGA